MRKLRCNPGGTLSPEETLGRESFITHLWRVLDRQSIYINDLRRIGKTQIMLAMHAKPPTQWQTAHCDLQGFHSADELVAGLQEQTFKHLDAWRKLKRAGAAVMDEARGADIDGVKLQASKSTWKNQIQQLFADLNASFAASDKQGARFIFFWDEFPYMLDNIVCRHGSQQAMEILDCVRKLEAANANIRLVLTGSIGLHHVLKELQKQGYHNSPLNRFSHEQPGPLPPEAAIELAHALLVGEQLNCEGAEAAHAHRIARAVGYVGFYIHKLVSRLPIREAITAELIELTLRREIEKLDGDWDLAHYRQRLEKYYGEKAALALFVLDAVAATQPIDFQNIYREVSGQLPSLSKDQLTAVLRLLIQDHYLVSHEGNYRFYLDLIRAWWRIERQLETPSLESTQINVKQDAP